MARLLDLPIDRFFNPTTHPRHKDVMELLRLWDDLKTDQDRNAALDFLRWMSVDSGR